MTADRPVAVVGLDGDDTLWHNETRFAETHARFAELLAPFADHEVTDSHLVAVERRNLRLFGYGVKGFTLSMIETAIELSDRRVDAATIHAIVEMGKAILDAPVELLDEVEATVTALAGTHRLVLVTKGDLFNQEAKVSASGLADLFWKVEIVSEKDPATYERILRVHDIDRGEFLMAGNSVRSDVLPVLDIGARAVHVPYTLTWALEQVSPEELEGRTFPVLPRLADLPALLAATG
jgi:putative hydrolase of the HAD superfamily